MRKNQLIERSLAKEKACGICRWERTAMCRECEHPIDDIPAADVELVKDGIWRYQTMSVPGGKGQTYSKWSCSRCRKKVKDRTKYCPNCGARMNTEAENG